MAAVCGEDDGALGRVAAALRCPYCAAALTVGRGVVRCAAGHAFDVARQGYVSLLPAGAPAGQGDTADMVAARLAFLEAGHYAPITRALAEACAGVVPAEAVVVDVGAGPGHHLAGVLDALPGRCGIAVDRSPVAARRAARAHPRMAAVVGDVWRGLPVADAAVAALLHVFAPRHGAEAARVLAPGGVAVVVAPGDAHLAELVGTLGLVRVDARKR